MTKVVGIERLNKTLTKELKPFGIKNVFFNDEYSYSYENNDITYKITENQIEDIWFVEFIKERFDYDVRYPFVMSLLHEVGHHYTDETIGDGELFEWCLSEKERIVEEMENADTKRSRQLEWQYFNLPDELVATAWAVRYAKENPLKIEQMWQVFKKALYKFYSDNGIFDDVENIIFDN